MKKFSQFISESSRSLASFHAKRLGLVGNGKGDWYNKYGEFVAKTEGGNLKFYDQNQRVGKDPDQVHPQSDKAQQKIAALKKSSQINKEQVNNEEIREKYISGMIFNENDIVRRISDGMIGRIIRRGANHLICVTEEDQMFKSWVHDLEEWTDESGVTADKREVGTDDFVKYTMKLTHMKKIQNMINKYKKNSKK
jgi:hypothetical protein